MENYRNDFEDFLIENFNKFDRPLFEEEFKNVFKNHTVLKLPTYHIEYLWELLRNADLLTGKQFDLAKYISIVSFYLRKLILMKDFVKKDFKYEFKEEILDQSTVNKNFSLSLFEKTLDFK